MLNKLQFSIFISFFLLASSSCGVKGPPLPPIASTPQKSDSLEKKGPSENPQPKPDLTPRDH